jgi:hypothetical protein
MNRSTSKYIAMNTANRKKGQITKLKIVANSLQNSRLMWIINKEL